MSIRIFIAFSALTLCNAKLTKTKSILLSDELSKYNTRLLQEFQPEAKSAKTSQIVAEYSRRVRSVFDSKSYESSLLWTHSEKLDENGDIVMRWVNSDGSITFRVEARTKGYLGVGFNSKKDMRGGDLVAAWVDDVSGIAQILDCHGLEIEDKAVTDDVQSYELISGYQNETHTTVEFRRQLDTCDAQDFIIGEDTVQVLWALGPDDSDGQLPKHIKSGSKPLRLVQPIPKPDVMLLKHWDVRLFNLTIPHDKATMFWCKIFKAPDLRTKHHIVGYRPIIDSRPIRNGRPVVEMDAPSPVHHMVLYECDDDGDKALWNEWSESAGAYGPARPKEWTICTTPVAAWAMGSKGEFLPENVGIPLGGNSGVSYYMLEVHYDNPALHEVLDSSGIRVHFTSELRRHDAGVLGSGIGVSALHVIPPKQIQYKTAGICSAECSRKMLPAEGVTIVSAQLHAHGTAKKISLKHVRGNNELRPITQENAYDARYQQSRAVPGGRQFMPGDILITECTYDSTERDKPILGGYSALQEMCLSFVVYYPRTNLAGCYSMTPVKEFFETFGIKEFYGINMLQVENMFLSSGSLDNFDSIEFDVRQHNDDTAMQGDDQGVGLLKELLIKEPLEFRNKSFIAHLNEMPWTEPLLTSQIEKTLYFGTHMTFCKKRDDSWGTPIEIQNFPNYTELVSNETVQKPCHFFKESLPSITKSTISDAGYVLAFSYWSPLICLNLLILAR